MTNDAKLVSNAVFYDLVTPYLDYGKSRDKRAATDLLEVHILVFNEGGENAMHHHPDDDHTFVVFEGEATFYLETDENQRAVGKHQCVLIPRNTNYRFLSSGQQNLVMLRIGANHEVHNPPRRYTPDGGTLGRDTPGAGYADYTNAVRRQGRKFGEPA